MTDSIGGERPRSTLARFPATAVAKLQNQVDGGIGLEEPIPIMRIVLRDKSSGLYFLAEETWIADPCLAREFPTTWEALQFCNANNLPPATVVMKAGESRYDVAVVDC
jgi:hypothetical protein